MLLGRIAGVLTYGYEIGRKTRLRKGQLTQPPAKNQNQSNHSIG